jgi:hypothetical protein
VAGALNPFVWNRPLGPDAVVGMRPFAERCARILKARTNVALFGPRGTGKTTFAGVLAAELAQDHGPGAGPFATVYVDLQHAFSLAAFASAVHAALVSHPDARFRRAAQARLRQIERELEVDLRVVKFRERRRDAAREDGAAQVLAEVLRVPVRVGRDVVVVLDEFQALRHCKGEPLAILRAVLLGPEAGSVSLLLTGSLRGAIELMLRSSREPLFAQAAELELPAIGHDEFADHLDLAFGATGRPIEPDALDRLLAVTRLHPKRTQQMAWQAWELAGDGEPVTPDVVEDALDRLLEGPYVEFAAEVGTLAAGGEADENDRRALYLLAVEGRPVTTPAVLTRYGFSTHSTLGAAVDRLVARGLLVRGPRGAPAFSDPLLAEWLLRTSPFRDRPA